MARFKRILLKLSGESLMGKQSFGIDPERLGQYAEQIKEVSQMGVQIGIVIGGGNIFRGLSGASKGFDRVKGDQMGMCATVINSLALSSALEAVGVKTQEYRNKIEFGCSNKRWFTSEELAQLPQKEDDTVTSLKERHAQNAIGFHITGAFDKIYPIKKCWLMDDLCNEIRNFVFEYADSHNYTFYDLREQHGLLRDMMIRNSNTGEWMLVFQFHYDEEGDEQRALELMQQVADKFPQITSLMYVDNQKGNDTINDLELSLFKGNDHIFELMEDLKFKVGPKSFYQTNTEQAYHLYCVAREFANLTGNELVYDLYTGTGTIANFVAHKAKKVIGIEYVPEAIEDAKVNSQINNIENTLFYAGDMKDILTNDFIAQHGRPDVIITDPPRAGMHPDVVNVILNAAPNRIVYVSCNPATQARDLQLMDDHYKVAAVQPVDMFPHTPHVENVVLLEKRSDAEIKQKKKERKEREKAIAEAKAAKEAEKLALEAAKAEDLTAEELAAKAEDLTAEELAAKK